MAWAGIAAIMIVAIALIEWKRRRSSAPTWDSDRTYALRPA
jgi:hypothetical protein